MKSFLTIGSLLAALSVILGAFGAHALKAKLSGDQLQVFETAVRYQMYHSLALILLFALASKFNTSLAAYAGWLFIAGIIFFSGSLYLLSCREILSLQHWSRILGPITPFGGLCFIAGWVCIILASIQKPIS